MFGWLFAVMALDILAEKKQLVGYFSYGIMIAGIAALTLTDYDGNKINLNDLNGYQKGVVLNDCMAYFNGGKYHGNETEPCGVVDIQDMEKITECTYGGSAFMKLKLNGKEYEVSVCFRENGQTYKTTADGTEDREKVIEAFNQLY